jgi:DNA transformation protein
MRESSFKDFILDKLADMEGVRERRMFGSFGLYCEKVFFGIISKGRLYFKTDESTSPYYIKEGMKPFRPSAKQTLKNYYEVPAEVVEDAESLVEWAKRAVGV